MKTLQDFGDLGEGGGGRRKEGCTGGEGEGGKRGKAVGRKGWGKEVKGIVN